MTGNRWSHPQAEVLPVAGPGMADMLAAHRVTRMPNGGLRARIEELAADLYRHASLVSSEYAGWPESAADRDARAATWESAALLVWALLDDA